jgi:hypothetical protein
MNDELNDTLKAKKQANDYYISQLESALRDEIKFLESCFDTWMDREHLERHIAKLVEKLKEA